MNAFTKLGSIVIGFSGLSYLISINLGTFWIATALGLGIVGGMLFGIGKAMDREQ